MHPANQRPCEGSVSKTPNLPATSCNLPGLPSSPDHTSLGEMPLGKKEGVLNPEGRNIWTSKPTQRELCVSVNVWGGSGGGEASTIGGVMVGVVLLRVVAVRVLG